MSVKPPSNEEEEYFAKQNAEAKRKLALEKKHAMAKHEVDALKQLHWMHCPKCGFEMHTVKLAKVSIDQCSHCHGIFLDDGEFERLIGHEPTLLQMFLAVFKGT